MRSLLIAVLLLVTSVARAQDAPRNLPTGGRSVLMGNTGIALGKDGSAPFLNPATIGAIDDAKLAFSVNLYRLTLNDVKSFYEPNPRPAPPFNGLTIADAGYLESEFDAVPSTLCLFFTIGSHELIEGNSPAGRQKLAFCFGQTYIDNFGLTATSANGRSPTLTTHEVVSATENLQKTSIGPTYGVAITDHLSIGASLHGTLTSRRSQWRATSISSDAAGKAITSALVDDAVGTSFEITSLIGATYRVAPVTLGLAVSLPAIHLYGTSRSATATQVTGTSGDVTDSVDATGSFSATPPVRFDLGAGFEAGKTTLELDLGVSLPKDAAFETTLQGTHSTVVAGNATTQPVSLDYVSPARASTNLAAGVEYRFTPGFGLLGGASMDVGFKSSSPLTGAGFHDYASRQDRVTASIGFGSYGVGGELLIGTELAYGFGERFAPDVFSLAPGFAVVPAHSYSALLVIAGSANIRAIKRAIDDVSAAVKAIQEKERREKEKKP